MVEVVEADWLHRAMMIFIIHLRLLTSTTRKTLKRLTATQTSPIMAKVQYMAMQQQEVTRGGRGPHSRRRETIKIWGRGRD